jgi:hypothetical protein
VLVELLQFMFLVINLVLKETAQDFMLLPHKAAVAVQTMLVKEQLAALVVEVTLLGLD